MFNRKKSEINSFYVKTVTLFPLFLSLSLAMHISISHVLGTLIQFCLISLVSTRARMHNDTRDWQAYRNWFLNSVLVFSSAKSINRARTDALANIRARIQRKIAVPPTCVLFVSIKPIASHIRLISHVRELRSRIFDLIASYIEIGFSPNAHAFCRAFYESHYTRVRITLTSGARSRSYKVRGSTC